MFNEEEFSTRFEDPMNFIQGLIDIGDTTEGPGADHTIKGVVWHGQVFSTQNLMIDRDRRCLDALLCQGIHAGVDINGGNFLDAIGIVCQV